MNARAVAGRVHERAREHPTELRYEGLVTRGIAFAMDAAVINLVAIVVAAGVALALSVLSVSKDSLDAVLIAAGGALFIAWSVGYFVTFWSTTGQTPGDRVLQIRVQDEDGRPLHLGRAVLRLLGALLSILLLFVGYLMILVDGRRRALHDRMVGSVVVYVPTTRNDRRRRTT